MFERSVLTAFTNFLIGQRFRVLLLGWIATYVCVSFLFAEAYSRIPGGAIDRPNGSELVRVIDFWNILHFSLTTQSTLGYGDLIPAGVDRWIAHGQALAGLVLNGLAFSIIASKILYAVPRIRFSKRIVYQPDVNRFWLRYINMEAFDLVDAEIRLYLQRPLFESGDNLYDVGLHVVHGSRIEEDIPPARLMALKSEPNEGCYRRADPLVRQLDKLSPPNLRPTNQATQYTPKLIVAINGISTGTSNRFSVRKAYSVDDVICGRFSRGVDNADHVKSSRAAKLREFLKLIDEITPTPPLRCDTCNHRDKCPLRLSSRGPKIQYVDSVGYFTGEVEYTTIHRDWKTT